MKNSIKYERGYKSAEDVIKAKVSKCDLQKLFDASYHALDQDDFDKGWQQACLDNGAITPDY